MSKARKLTTIIVDTETVLQSFNWSNPEVRQLVEQLRLELKESKVHTLQLMPKSPVKVFYQEEL